MLTGIRFIVAAVLASAYPVAQPGQPPDLRVAGFPVMTRTAEATRVALLGQIDLYTIGLFTDAPISDVAQLATDDRAKALRIEVRYDSHNLRMRPRLALDWGRELVPSMSPAASGTLRGAVAGLRSGDVVIVAYAPRRGTTVRVNRSIVVSNSDHDLMLSFLDHWLGQTPLSQEVKDTLLDQILRRRR